MEQESKITWESPVESAEQMLSEHAAQSERFAKIRKMLAESKEIMREMIGRMNDEDVLELVELCLDEMELRDYSVLRLCVNTEKVDSPYMLDVVGNVGHIASSLMYLSVKNELFAKCVLAVARDYEARREEFEALIEEDEEAE